MKNLILSLTLSSLFLVSAQAQEPAIKTIYSPLFYGGFNLGWGKYKTKKLDFNFRAYKGLYAGLAYSNLKDGQLDFTALFKPNSNKINDNKIGLVVGYLLNTNSENIKFIMNLNPYLGRYGYVTGEANSQDPNQNSGLFDFNLFSSPHYVRLWSYQQYSGIIIESKLLITVGKIFGLTLSAQYDRNPIDSQFSFNTGIVIGLLKGGMKKKTVTQHD
jgi:hypothetical protein